jgi:hypothetical protein
MSLRRRCDGRFFVRHQLLPRMAVAFPTLLHAGARRPRSRRLVPHLSTPAARRSLHAACGTGSYRASRTRTPWASYYSSHTYICVSGWRALD